jgi:hypothetical protein
MESFLNPNRDFYLYDLDMARMDALALLYREFDLYNLDMARMDALALKFARDKKAKKTPPKIVPTEKSVYVAEKKTGVNELNV